MTDAARGLLVVDDEEDFRVLFRNHFRKRGYRVLEAADGVEALALFESRVADIDLVVTDIRMPRMNGEQLIKALRRLRRYLPIIGVTGQADLHGKLAFLDEGAYYYLDKPVEHWAIVERLVDNAIRLHHHEEALSESRRKESEIARLLRAYILKGPVQSRLEEPSSEHRVMLDIAIEPVEITPVSGDQAPSGDYVEWFERDGDEVIFYVADASGHSDLVSSFTACLSNMVLHRCHHGGRPTVDEIIRFIDRAFDQLRAVGALSAARYLTFFIGCVKLATGELSYVNAGHPEAFLLRAGSDSAARFESLPSTCQPVGHLSLFNQEVRVERRQLAVGDLLFAYTDGASEMLEDGEDPSSGGRHLRTVIEPLQDASARQVVDAVKEYLVRHAGEEGFDDDTTLLAVRVNARRGRTSS